MTGPQNPPMPVPGVCTGCGCTEERACAGGCRWANRDKTFCSACVRKIYRGPLEESVRLIRLAPIEVVRRVAEVLLPARARCYRGQAVESLDVQQQLQNLGPAGLAG